MMGPFMRAVKTVLKVVAGFVLLGVAAMWVAVFAVYPKTVKEVPNNAGTLAACVLVEPAHWFPLSLTTLFNGCNVDIMVQVKDAKTGKVLFNDELSSNEDCESDARDVTVTWTTSKEVDFLYGRYDRKTYTVREEQP